TRPHEQPGHPIGEPRSIRDPDEDERPRDVRFARQRVAPLPREVGAPFEAPPVVVVVGGGPRDTHRAAGVTHPSRRQEPRNDEPAHGRAVLEREVLDLHRSGDRLELEARRELAARERRFQKEAAVAELESALTEQKARARVAHGELRVGASLEPALLAIRVHEDRDAPDASGTLAATRARAAAHDAEVDDHVDVGGVHREMEPLLVRRRRAEAQAGAAQGEEAIERRSRWGADPHRKRPSRYRLAGASLRTAPFTGAAASAQRSRIRRARRTSATAPGATSTARSPRAGAFGAAGSAVSARSRRLPYAITPRS